MIIYIYIRDTISINLSHLPAHSKMDWALSEFLSICSRIPVQVNSMLFLHQKPRTPRKLRSFARLKLQSYALKDIIEFATTSFVFYCFINSTFKE